jgi:hypothetical protein
MTGKCTFLLVLLLVAVLSTAQQPKDYTTKYDNVDVERILSNGRILTNYIKCVLDEGPCTPEGRELKSKLAALDMGQSVLGVLYEVNMLTSYVETSSVRL